MWIENRSSIQDDNKANTILSIHASQMLSNKRLKFCMMNRARFRQSQENDWHERSWYQLQRIILLLIWSYHMVEQQVFHPSRLMMY